ncbi:MAG: DinB family protein [Chloroflexi bacterium]|nr:DinB family protein [Chloroflexota bacterium]
MPGSNGLSPAATGRAGALVAELVAARGEFLAALDAVDPSRLTRSGLVGEWSARELIAHLGYWAGHAAELIHAAEHGDAPEAGLSGEEVEARNRTVARVAAQEDLATVRLREQGAFDALAERLAAIAPELLDLSLDGPGTLEQAIDEDGAAHYREHAEQLRGDRP